MAPFIVAFVFAASGWFVVSLSLYLFVGRGALSYPKFLNVTVIYLIKEIVVSDTVIFLYI